MSFHTRKYVIIAAGGSGSRFNSDLPKQFIELQGVPMLMRTIDAFKNAIAKIEVILVLPIEHIQLWAHLQKKYDFELEHRVVTGGETRFNSVKNGLAVIESDEGLVAIHDGVRPLVSKELIKSVFQTAEEKGNAVPVINVNDSLRKVDGKQNEPVDREDFRIVQTPQCFELETLKKSFNQTYSPSFTDEASVVESSGAPINLMEGETNNIKITTTTDLLIAEAFFKG